MKPSPSPAARVPRFLGSAALACSLLAALTACGTEDTPGAAQPPAAPVTAEPTASTPETKDEIWGHFVRVVDGDTVEVQPVDGHGEPTGEPNLKISMLGVKAPEASECGGPEAADYLDSRILPGEGVTFTYDPALGDAVDDDGNPLGYVVTGAGIILNINNLMVNEGYAVAWHAGDGAAPEKSAQYESSQKSAEQAGKGLWATCGTMGG